MSRPFDVLVLGAGAAGLFCAAEAGKRGRRVAVLERAERAGKKILISGGGRCNFTNIYCRPENFLSANPHFAKSALARFTPDDFIALVEKHKIPYHEKTLGQLFCDHSAQEITGLLDAECRDAGVKLFLNEQVREVTKGTQFVVRTDTEEFRAPTLVVATGGLSIPKMGATSFGYELARQFELKIQPTRPGLVPLILGRKAQKEYCDLAGVSAEVTASIENTEFPEKISFREKMLITHRGLSGPAILQISSYWQHGKAINLDLVPGREVTLAVHSHIRLINSAGFVRFLLVLFLFFEPVYGEGICAENFVVQNLCSIDGLIEVPAKVLAGHFFNGLQEVFLGGMHESILHEIGMHAFRHRVFADDAF